MRAPDADPAITALYSTEYRSLVEMSAVLPGDVGTAEEVVQDCFLPVRGAWFSLRDSDKALSYLRRSVVNRSRSVLRHRAVPGRKAPKPLRMCPAPSRGGSRGLSAPW